MSLTARCHSLRPYKNSGWLSYFGLEPQGDRAAHFFTVGPAEGGSAEDRDAALRAGQAVVRYLKEVPDTAPASTVLSNTRRIVKHEADAAGTRIDYAVAVLEKDSLFLATQGDVFLVPLHAASEPLQSDGASEVGVDASSRYFFGHVPATLRTEASRPDFGARLERGGTGDGGLVIAFASNSGLVSVPGRKKKTASVIAPELPLFPSDPISVPTPPESGTPGAPQSEIADSRRGQDSARSETPSPPAKSQPPSTGEQTNLPLNENAAAVDSEHAIDAVAPSVADILGADDTDSEPPRPQATAVDPPSSTLPASPRRRLREGRSLSFWIGTVAALTALALFVVYLAQWRPEPRPETAQEEAPAVEPTPDLTTITPGIVWEQTFGDAVTSSPLVADGRVVFGCRDGSVYAIDPEDGARVWAYAAGDGFGSSPVVAGEVIAIGGYDGRIYGLDLITGAERWSFATGGRVVASPATAEGVVFAGSYDKHLYALSATDGSVVWKRDLGGIVWASPIVADELVIAADLAGKVTAVDRKTGVVRWQSKVGGELYSSPEIGEGKVFIGAENALLCLNLTDGGLVWTVDAGSKVNSSPRYHQGRVVVGSDSGAILAVDVTLGQKVWDAVAGGAVKSRPAFEGSLVWITSYDGFLYGIDWMTGAPEARINVDAAAFSSPAIRGGKAYFGGLDGRFFAVRLGLATP